MLQKVGGVKKFMRVAPLFETREDLINAPKVVDAVLSVPWYKNHIQGKQEVQPGAALQRFRALLGVVATTVATEDKE